MRVVLITGMSGSGKSVALRLLEDIGYYCVDNLPARFFGELCDHLMAAGYNDVAVSIDARSQASLEELPVIVEDKREQGHDIKVLFLTASDNELVQRYSESRRRHPMAQRLADRGVEVTLSEAISTERHLLAPLDTIGHRIDTSGLLPSALRNWVRDFVDSPRAHVTLAFESFAFKRGLPVAADLVFDVRNLPNPYYDAQLRPLTGLDAPVANFLQSAPHVAEMIDDIARFIDRWLPSYITDNRHYLTVAIGCTGGQHRSVYVVQTLAQRFNRLGHVLTRHRALG